MPSRSNHRIADSLGVDVVYEHDEPSHPSYHMCFHIVCSEIDHLPLQYQRNRPFDVTLLELYPVLGTVFCSRYFSGLGRKWLALDYGIRLQRSAQAWLSKGQTFRDRYPHRLCGLHRYLTSVQVSAEVLSLLQIDYHVLYICISYVLRD